MALAAHSYLVAAHTFNGRSRETCFTFDLSNTYCWSLSATGKVVCFFGQSLLMFTVQRDRERKSTIRRLDSIIRQTVQAAVSCQLLLETMSIRLRRPCAAMWPLGRTNALSACLGSGSLRIRKRQLIKIRFSLVQSEIMSRYHVAISDATRGGPVTFHLFRP